MAGWQVTEQAVAAMNNMSAQLQELAEKIHQESEKMKSVFGDTQDGLGAHSSDISELIQSIELAVQDGSRPLAKLQLKLNRAALIRQNRLEENRYGNTSSITGIAASGTASGVVNNSTGSNYMTDSDVVAPHQPADSDKASLYGGGSFTPLLETQQAKTHTYLDGTPVTVFDHPLDDSPGRICNQGSAYPTGPQGTCGCCACGTIINKAGGTTNEHEVVAFAWDNELCSDSGGTSPASWVGILNGAGIASQVKTGETLESLAEAVEEGKGVVIGVSACTYYPEMYGRYFPGKADGHALVIESVVRDEKTGKILGYYVSDSNGSSSKDACKYVPAKRLERAFRRRGGQSITTDEIIW